MICMRRCYLLRDPVVVGEQNLAGFGLTQNNGRGTHDEREAPGSLYQRSKKGRNTPVEQHQGQAIAFAGRVRLCLASPVLALSGIT